MNADPSPMVNDTIWADNMHGLCTGEKQSAALHLGLLVGEGVQLGDGDAVAVGVLLPDLVNVPLGVGVGVQLLVDVGVPLGDKLHVAR